MSRMFSIKKNEVEREDNLLLSLADLTEEKDSFFSFEELSFETHRIFFREATNIRFTVSNDLTEYRRSVYNLFLLLGDVGGFAGMLFVVGQGVMSVLNYQRLDNYMVSLFDSGHQDSRK